MKQLRAISLFTNCGAGDLGYRQAGFHFDVMAELDARRLDVALLNHPGAVGVAGDLRLTWPRVVEAYRQQTDQAPALLCACPPCQGMSSVRAGRGNASDADAGSRDARNLLVTVISRVARSLRPKIVVVENVPQFFSRKVRHPRDRRAISAAEILREDLHRDYECYALQTDLADYGVPQRRKRVFLTFLRRDLKGCELLRRDNRAPFPRPTHALDVDGSMPISVGEALRAVNLPILDARTSASVVVTKRAVPALHVVPKWSDRVYAMVAQIPPHSGASAWENNTCVACGKTEIDEALAVCPKCGEVLPRPVIKARNGRFRLIKGFDTSYKRMKTNEPAATITTASGHIGSHTTIHPFENRLLSPLECAVLQTFPLNFKWGNAMKSYGATNVRDMIGEAVPPLFTRRHGQLLVDVLRAKHWRISPIARSDSRCKWIAKQTCSIIPNETRRREKKA